MSEEKEFSLQEVGEHNTKKDLYIVVHDKVYDTTKFVDEHPGGEEVLLDVAGQEATEAFEDVGHSDEAREILDGLLVGKVKRAPGEEPPSRSSAATSTSQQSQASTGLGIGLYAIIILGGAVGYGVYQYLQNAQQNQA